MKILHMNLYFELPDDFEGSFNDALAEVIKYRKSKNNPRMPESGGSLNYVKDTIQSDLWERFLKAKSEGFKLHGLSAMQEYKDGEWSRLD